MDLIDEIKSILDFLNLIIVGVNKDKKVFLSLILFIIGLNFLYGFRKYLFLFWWYFILGFGFFIEKSFRVI